MNGKARCKILKDIRKQIADSNDISYVVSECHYQGNCKGTCPQCEAELRYLEEELRKRQKIGKAVLVGGISAAMLLAAAGGAYFVCDALKEQEESKVDLMGSVVAWDEEIENPIKYSTQEIVAPDYLNDVQ